jgi:hypothetical protein
VLEGAASMCGGGLGEDPCRLERPHVVPDVAERLAGLAGELTGDSFYRSRSSRIIAIRRG